MTETLINNLLSSFPKNSLLKIKYLAKNGEPLERLTFFEGFDLKDNPLLHMEDSRDYLDVHCLRNGCKSIISFSSYSNLK